MFEEFTGLHSEVREDNAALSSQDLKASSSAIENEKKGAPFLLNPIILIECWPAQSTFVFPTVIKITKAFGFIQIRYITKILNAEQCAGGKIF